MAGGPIRAIAFYLPQFHPIPENDEWWGKGFTEWTNTAKAKPLFKGHYQPHVPADLGFYDLRCPETRIAQAELAKRYGVDGFCYYHYWFAGRRLLQRPFEEVVASGEPDFPFCLCWANQTWTGIWHGSPNRILMEQTYPGLDDHELHFRALFPAFCDARYITIDKKPVFIVYDPEDLSHSVRVTDFWRSMAVRAGLPGLFLLAVHNSPEWNPHAAGFDGVIISRLPPRRFYMKQWVTWKEPVRKLKYWNADRRRLPTIHRYEFVTRHLITDRVAGIESFPCVIPNWDNTPRSGENGLVMQGSTPGLFRRHLVRALERTNDNPNGRSIVFIKSWNEWAEGNHLEPDLRFGNGYLEVLREELARFRGGSDAL